MKHLEQAFLAKLTRSAAQADDADPIQEFFADPLISLCLSHDVQKFCEAYLSGRSQA